MQDQDEFKLPIYDKHDKLLLAQCAYPDLQWELLDVFEFPVYHWQKPDCQFFVF